MAYYSIFSNTDPRSGRVEKTEGENYSFVVWKGQAANLEEAKEKASDHCMRRVKKIDMKALRMEDGNGYWEDQ